METFLKFDLYLHISAGIVGLLAGMIAMIVRKGSNIHKRAGVMYYWAMFVICSTALIRFKPTPSLIFLTTIAIFSFYMSFSGKRILSHKKPTTDYQTLDWVAACITFGCGIAMIVSGIYFWFANNFMILGILFIFFGTLCSSIARNDIEIFRGKIELEKMHWFFHHIGRMSGSFSATLTAFFVTNNHGLLPDLLIWISPGVIIGLFADVLANRYRKDFKMELVPLLPLRVIKSVLKYVSVR